MAGFALTAADVNNKAGSLAFNLWSALQDARQFNLWLNDSVHTDAFLGAGGVGVTAADLTIIRASFADLGGGQGLFGVAHGSFAPTGASNYFSNARQLTGINYGG